MIISIPKPLKEKLGDEGSKSLVEMMNQFEKSHGETVLAISEQRYEKTLAREFADFKIENNAIIIDLRKEMHDEIRKLRNELLGKIQELRDEVFEEIHKLRNEMYKQNANTIKWTFVFWLGQTGVIAGIILALVR